MNGYSVSNPLFTVGDSINDYTPPGVLDGLGAYEKDEDTVRVLANHELLNFRGYAYDIENGPKGENALTGARVSYFDIDKDSMQIVDAGLAYNTIYDANGVVATDNTFLTAGFNGFSRLCSSVLVEAGEFNRKKGKQKKRRLDRGLEDTIYFTGEEDGGYYNPVGGAEWALDVESGEIWQVPAMGRGAWENVSAVDTRNKRQVAFILMDDSSPFDFDGDGVKEAAPLFLYLGNKNPRGDFLDRNGLRDGQLYVWVSDSGETTPAEFNTSGTLKGTWVMIDNSPKPDMAKDADAPDFDRNGYDEYGYPTQGNLWLQARDKGAFGFSRPEDAAYNPRKPNEVVIASTGVDTYVDGADTFGTVYTVKTNFRTMKSKLKIIYDGDADATRALRSPDNLDWADDGYVYIQEDEAEEDTLDGEPLFGEGAVNPNEAGIVRLDPKTGETLRVANIDRSVVLDASLDNPADAFDMDIDSAGEWESSGILDVSELFDEDPGTLFLFDVQAHGVEDQNSKTNAAGEGPNPESRIDDYDLVEGGQLLFLIADDDDLDDDEDEHEDDDDNEDDDD